MAGTEKPQVDRRQKRRDKRQGERARTGDTPQAVAERTKSVKRYDEGALQKLGERTGIFG